MKTEFFSPVDAAWLHMDKPSNLAMIAGVMMFETPVEFERLRGLIEERLLIYERFRQRVKEPLLGLGLPQWETVPRLDMGYHLKRVTLAAPGDEAALQALAGELMSLPLDRRHPLWQFHFVDGYGAGTAVIARLHHCIADGLALVQVLLSMTDTSPEPVKPTTQAAAHHSASPLENLFAPVNRLVATTVTTAESLLQAGLLTLANPRRLIDAAKIGALGALAASKLLLLNPDRQTLFKGQCGVTKRAVWSKPIQLAEVKTLAHALHGTVNDVLLAAVTGALRRYLESKDQSVAGLNIRAMVPVNLRPPDRFNQLGNQFGLVILSLPVGARDPVQRIIVLKKRMDDIKDTPEALVAFGLLGGMGVTPAQIEDVLVKFFASKVSAVMTNVPGPRETIYLAGEPLKRIMFWVPQPGNLSLGVSIISYAGEVIVGVATDAGLIPDPDQIIAAFDDEIAHLKAWITPGEMPQRAARSKHPAEVKAVEVRRCHGHTRTSQPCKNRALPNSDYCRLHQPAT